MQALQDAIESVRDDNAIPSGLVRVTLSRFAYQLIFRPFIAEFGARYPHIQLELSLCDGTINILDAGYDLGIRFGDTLEEGMVARRLLPPFKGIDWSPLLVLLVLYLLSVGVSYLQGRLVQVFLLLK